VLLGSGLRFYSNAVLAVGGKAAITPDSVRLGGSDGELALEERTLLVYGS
jgi:hypothetical protein